MKSNILKNNQVKVLAAATGFAVAALLTGNNAWAGQDTGTFNVTASVAANCKITTTSDVAFGAYDPLGTGTQNATGSISVACTKGTSSAVVALDNGENYAAGTRQMKGGTTSSMLAYKLFEPSSNAAGATCAYTTEWNSTNTLSLTSAPSKAARTYNVCGQIALGQDVAADSYSDLVTATVTF